MIRAREFCSATLFTSLMVSGLFTAGSAMAEEGKIIIKPLIEVEWQNDANFYKSQENERSVTTYSIKPGLEFGYKTPKSKIEFLYTADVIFYDDKDDVPAGRRPTDDFDYVGHLAQVTAEIRITDRLSLGLDEYFIVTRDAAQSDAFSNIVDRSKYTMNTFTPKMVYRFGDKTGFTLNYTNLLTDYADDFNYDGLPNEDSMENRGAFDLFYNLNSTYSLDLLYQIWNRDYDLTTSDYTSNQVMLNLNSSYKYFTLTGGIGYHNRSFDMANLDDMDAFAWKLQVSGQNPPDADGIPRSQMAVSLSQNLNDAGSGNQYYTATRADFSFGMLFVEKLNSFIKGYYQNSDYETSDREDDTLFISGGIDYLINDYLTAGFEVGHEERDSNLTGRDYDNQYVMFKLACQYDLGSR